MGIKNEKYNSKKHISAEILNKIGGSILIVLIIITLVVTVMITVETCSSNEDKLTLQSQSVAWELTSFFGAYTRVVEQLAVEPNIKDLLIQTGAGETLTQTEGYDTVYDILLAVQQTDSDNIMATWIADLDASNITQSDGFTSGPDWDITQRAWSACMETGMTVLTEPYKDSSTGLQILSAATPVYDDAGKVIGAVGADLSMEHVSEVMGSYTVGKSGYLILFTGNGTVIFHPNSQKLEKNVTEIGASDNLISTISNHESNFLNYKIDKASRYGYACNVGDSGYMVLTSMPFSEYYSELRVLLFTLILVFAIGLVIIIRTIMSISRKITEPVEQLNEVAKKLAEGDLDVELHVTMENEIGELAASIAKTVARLKEYIVYIDEISKVLGEMASGKLRIELKNDYVGEFSVLKEAMLNISASMSHVMEEISASASQVSQGADELAGAAQMLAENATNQTASVDSLVDSAKEVTERVSESRSEAENSAKATNQVTELMKSNQEKMNEMMEAMRKIQETSQKVVGIIATIEEIADQTNLLSLNASIEAARAGEVGRGFAVVAADIGKLADESANAASTTKDLIGVSMEEIEHGNEIAQKVLEALEDAVNAVDQVNQMISKTADSSAEQAISMQNMEQGMETISQAVSDNSAVAEESSATSQELAAQAGVLNELIGKFTF